MAIPITIETLMQENVVEWARIEFKEGWNPNTTLKTICAFANDIDNWGGGYLVIGVKEKQGVVKKPIEGLKESELDWIQKELNRYCHLITPSYLPVCEPVIYEGKNLLLVWCPGGYDRPYRCPKRPTSKKTEKIYYIRKFSSTIEATQMDVEELHMLKHNVPYDDRVNVNAQLSDLKYPLVTNYLNEVHSNLLNHLQSKTMKDLALDLRIAGGPKEYFKPLNVGLLFFNENPDRFFPGTQIDVVNIPDPTGQGMEERIFKGPINQQLQDVLSYVRNNVIAEKVFKVQGQAEAIRIKNYSYEAIEEFISNAVYHKSYQLYDPITVRIEKECIEITNTPGPDRSIRDEDIKNYTMRARRYRNRRIGDFLKELHLVEGRNTGIPTAIRAIQNNGSPLPKLLTDEERTFFSVILPIHEAFLEQKDTTKYVKRKNKQEIKKLVLNELEKENLSSTSLYRKLGYSGNVSKTFRCCIDDLIKENKIKYVEENKNSASNVLTKISE